MLERMTVNTGVRLTPTQVKKLDHLAANMRTSRNRLMGMLIDSAEVQTVPSVSVGLQNNNRHDAKALSGQSVTAVSA